MMYLQTILFQGDSITDCQRQEHQSLGNGYVKIISERLNDFVIMNRGISGNRTVDLLGRVDRDIIDIHPDILFILIGVNDVWHMHKYGKHQTIQEFESHYRNILMTVKKKLPQTKIVLINPLLFSIGEILPSWNIDIEEEIEVIHHLASEFSTRLVLMDEIFKNHLSTYSKEELLPDGVRPSLLGHSLIAEELIQVIKQMTIN